MMVSSALSRYSTAFYQFRKEVAKKRRDFLRPATGVDLMFPPLGQAWFPSRREQALCDSFIVLFVAELETYLEYVVNTALDQYQKRFVVSGLQECAAGTEFVEKIVAKRVAWAKNNNANWSRIEEYFRFIGLTKAKFPANLWDHIEAVVSQRGDIVHNSLGVRNISDPRQTINHISKALRGIALFDRDFLDWQTRAEAERTRLANLELRFVPGLGSIST